MKRFFYTHLIEIESLTIELDELDLSNEEKTTLASLIDENLHHQILNAVLSELNDEEKKEFLRHLHQSEDDKLWKFLNEKVDDIEDKIKKAANDLKEEMCKDIKESQRLKLKSKII
ncbi:hypothetical protein HYW42_02190 [Candidatus Daviesbacteria bacterium]|nr:hypothetical protein [Candidatus Daviesbacteria bacterium]